jgi:hypothetical protein
VTYYYSAFAGDNIPNYSSPVTLSITPEDSIPPGSVTSFAAFGSDRLVRLTWTNPEDIDVTGVLITYSLEGPIVLPESGDPVENGNDGIFPAAYAEADSFTHTGLLNDTTYYYCIAAFDEVENYSGPVATSVFTNDQVPPGLSISVFQNPYITNHLDIFLVGSEPLADTSVVVTVNGDEIATASAGTAASVYRADYDIYASGALTIDVAARDMNLNWASSSRTYNASKVLARSGDVLSSADGALRLTIPGGVLGQDMFIMLSDALESCDGLISAHEISPSSVVPGGLIEISMAYDQDLTDPEHLCIARLEGDDVRLLASVVDRADGRITAAAYRFGTYGLYRSDTVVSPDRYSAGLRLIQNAPNPFSSTTRVAYEIGSPSQVRLEIVSVEGRLVKTLWAGVAGPGQHQIEWDGTDESGRRVASGVYLCRITSQTETATRKMVLLE